MNLTHLEAVVLNEIALHEMSPVNGDAPETIAETGTFCWADDFTGGKMSVNAVKGVLSSLVKKDLINIGDWDGEHNYVDFTVAGFEAWKDCDALMRRHYGNRYNEDVK